MKFLHIADIHLGCTRYNLAESPRDFFDAWIDVLNKYALEERVDFVLMSGDFFHKRNVPPETMNHAFAGLSLLRDAGIPVIAIEGNHDQKHTDSEFSWLRSLADWGLLVLLEPTVADGKVVYEPWNPETLRGGFIDVKQARVFGSKWFGASANWAMPMLADSIRYNRREGALHILLLHTDVEGFQTHPIPALSTSALNGLRPVTDYVALGHTHKHYVIDNWAFNPGSIEVTNIGEYRETRGVFVVEVDENGQINSRHADEYRHRPFQRLEFSVDGCDPEELTGELLAKIKNEARVAEPGEPEPIIEITLRGRLGFPNSRVEMAKIRERVQEMTNALHVKIRNHAVPIEYVDNAAANNDLSREELERRVVESLVEQDNRYKANAANVSQAVVGAKRLALSDEPPEKITDFIAAKMVAE
ncbi:MAG: exonuclease SbcCD subunit D [Acidobacteriota bacterium]